MSAHKRHGAVEGSRQRRAAAADWVFHADEPAILRALESGRRAGGLREYFGAAAHAELTQLARKAGKAAGRGGPRVLIIPGIMGTRLAGIGPGSRARKIFWIDPALIATGGLKALALPAGAGLRPAGVVPLAYLKLKLQLCIDGFAAEFHPYDWRLDLDESASLLASRIAAAGAPVTLIGHSMGGLVARIAAAKLPKRSVRRLILLGTPNFGSYAPVLAIRGTYPFVRRLAALDRRHTPEFLADCIFSTFPGLYQLLPRERSPAGIDLLNAAQWPCAGPGPRPELLRQVAGARAKLTRCDARMLQIVGVDRKTVVGVRRKGRQFEYSISLNGDGTVPRSLALLPGLRTFYVDEWHAQLPSSPRVIDAIVDVLRRGHSRALPTQWPMHRGRHERFDDAALRGTDGPKIDWRRLNSTQRAATLAELNS